MATTKEGTDEKFFPIKITYNGHKYRVTENGQIVGAIKAGERAPSDSNAEYISGSYTAVIPAGFTVSNQPGESSIETGLVIRDDSGNEFVWIPVGIPWKSDANKTLTLGRYIFKSDGTIDDEKSKTNGSAISITDPWNKTFNVIEEEARITGNNQNTVAKNINDFIIKTNEAGD